MLLTDDEIFALHAAPFDNILDLWEEYENRYGPGVRKDLGLVDRFYLLVVLLHRLDALHPWLYARCREVELDTDGYLDLWAREHYKSTIITFAGIIQEILRDPEITIVIFSHTKPIARKFMLQIKQEFETNEELVKTYPDVLWSDPRKEAPKWSEEKGLVVRRKSNPKEATLEAHGLIDGQPTGGHWTLRVYDDVVTPESVSTPEQVAKATAAWELSDNLGARSPGVDVARAWHVGTRYSFADTYNDIMERGALKPRIYPATHNGLADGIPVMLTPAAWAAKKLTQGPATIACQMLQNPAAGNEAMFKKEWLQFIDIRPSTLNVYIMVDPASSKKKGSDNTAMAVIGIDSGGNKYFLDGYRHKMNLRERWENMRNLRRVWMSRPGVQMVKVGYEKYGMQSDMEYFEEQMQRDKDAFEIIELSWTKDGTESKSDRVQRLVPDFAAGKFFMAQLCVRKTPLLDEHNQPVIGSDGEPVMVMKPYETANQIKLRERGQGFRIFEPVKRRDHEGNVYSLNKGFLDEYLFFPFSSKKDLIDAVSRLYDMEPVSPTIIDQSILEPTTYSDGV
jgi:phage terminase large subunit-like protein